MTELLDDPTPREPSEPLEESEPAANENASSTAPPQHSTIPATRVRPSPSVHQAVPQASAVTQGTIVNPRIVSIQRYFPGMPSTPGTSPSIDPQPLPFSVNTHASYSRGSPLLQRSAPVQPSVAATSGHTFSRPPVTTYGSLPAKTTPQRPGGIQAAQNLYTAYATGPTLNAIAMAPPTPASPCATGATPNALAMAPSAPRNTYATQAIPAHNYNFTYQSPYGNTATTGQPNATATLAQPARTPAQILTQPLGQNVGLPVPQSLNFAITALRALPKVGSTDHPERKMLKKPYEGNLTNASPAEREIREHFFGGSGKLKEDSELRHWYGDLTIFSAEMWEFLMVQKPRPGGN